MLASLIHVKQALRTTPLRLMVLTQALAIAALLTVLLTADRYQQYFVQEAAQLMGGDLVLNADRPLPDSLAEQARKYKLAFSRTTQFSSVVIAGEQQALVSVKAVSDTYPLRGTMTFTQGGATKQAPVRGTVWVDPQLLMALNLTLGDTVMLGQTAFKISGVIDIEPDRGAQFASFAPRVMLHEADVPDTQLLGPGSRATYRWQFAGTPSAVAAIQAQLKAQLKPGQRLETLEEGRPEMKNTLDRASIFLGLVAILTTLIAACGLGLVAHIWATEQTQWVATMRTFGATTWVVVQRVLGIMGWVSALGFGLGVAAAYLMQFVLSYVLNMSERLVLPAPSWVPFAQGFVLLLVLLWVCVYPAMQRLLAVSPMQILRPNLKPSALRAPWLMYGLAGMASAGLMMWVAHSVLIGSVVLGGLVGLVLVLSMLLTLLMATSVRYGRSSSSWLVRTASRGLLRQKTMTLVQASTLTLALLGVLTLAILQQDVLNAWQKLLPKDAPNHFILNVQPDQAAAVQSSLQAMGVSQVSMLPMIRARLIAVNGKPIGPDTVEGDRAKRLVDREFNMSYLEALPAGNTVVAGSWDMTGEQGLSMEEGIMQTLKLNMGDQLRFDVAGQTIDLTINSVRKLRWETLNVNFFAIAAPRAAQNMPQTFITAVRVAQGVKLTSLVKQFPNLTVLDVGGIATQAQGVLDKLTRALQLLFSMALLAGVLVVAVSSYAQRVVRQREAVLLRVMGASTWQIRLAQLLEIAGLGALAGLLAGCMAYGLVWSLAYWVIELPVSLGMWSVYIGVVFGVVLNVLGGLLTYLGDAKLGLSQRLRLLS